MIISGGRLAGLALGQSAFFSVHNMIMQFNYDCHSVQARNYNYEKSIGHKLHNAATLMQGEVPLSNGTAVAS
jgi:hypothetical protein